jgi:redox-sensing transcriptional repressor
MVRAGIKGVLNFAPMQLKTVGDCVVNNVNLELELENLIYFVNAMQKSAGVKIDDSLLG